MTDRDLVAIVLEDVSRKFDLILEAHASQKDEMDRRFVKVDAQFEDLKAAIRFTNVDLRQRIDDVEDRLTKRIDAMADDLAAHRADTESHALYRVKEGG